MEIGHSIKQKQSLRLNLTLELQQSIQILQMSASELADYLQEQSVVNPILDIMWRSSSPKSAKSSTSGSSYQLNGPDDLINRICQFNDTLEEVLLSQLRTSEVPKRLYEITRYLIGNLNEAGYLEIGLEEVCVVFNTTLEQVQAALSYLQSFEPFGVGARNLRECLLIQIEKDQDANELAFSVVSNYLLELASGKHKQVADKLMVEVEDLQRTLVYIRSLDPRPGLPYSSPTKMDIRPDAYIQNDRGNFVIIMNERLLPKVSLNPHYLNLMFQTESKEASSYLREHLHTSKLILRSIEHRNSTIYRVIESISERQRDFLEHGTKHLKPMILKEIAEKLKLHESTISRAIRNKYVQTAQGIFELKFFFTSGLANSDGEYSSSKSLKAKIKDLIHNEDKKRPFSDQHITDLLTQEGIQISRRTVMKYREEMKLLSSRFRTEIV